MTVAEGEAAMAIDSLEALRSFYPDADLWLLDDCSTDGTGEAVLAVVERITQYTRPFNFLGIPTISVPCGFTRNGLPVAFQVAAKPFAEPLVLRVAHAYQGATDHHERVPQM